MRRRRSQEVVRVRVPTDQAPLFHIPGPHGGWFISYLYNHGYSVDVPMQELRKLLAGSRGEVIVARRLTHEEAGKFERRRLDCDAEAHAFTITKEETRFRRPRRGDRPQTRLRWAQRGDRPQRGNKLIKSVKLAVRAANHVGNKLARPRRGGA